MPLFSEPNRRLTDDVTNARCPVCEQTDLTVVAELSSSVFFSMWEVRFHPDGSQVAGTRPADD
jgi:hypothetical protein